MRGPAISSRSIAETERARFNDRITGFRDTPQGQVPYYTREEIVAGALAGRGLELLYLDDPVELFYMQVQGSGVVRLPDGSAVRLSYAGKNGYPYTSIGKLLVERGEIAKGAANMESVKAWLHADPARGGALMEENRSYVFFRELGRARGRRRRSAGRAFRSRPGGALPSMPPITGSACRFS